MAVCALSGADGEERPRIVLDRRVSPMMAPLGRALLTFDRAEEAVEACDTSVLSCCLVSQSPSMLINVHKCSEQGIP